jgi:hypothetical protein
VEQKAVMAERSSARSGLAPEVEGRGDDREAKGEGEAMKEEC